MADQQKCIECGGAMHAIRVLDQGNLDAHRQLEYSAVDAQRSSAMGADASSSSPYHHSDDRNRA
jgi:hypothetical protein